MNDNGATQSLPAEAIDWLELSAEELPAQYDLTLGFSTSACYPGPPCISCMPCGGPMTMAGSYSYDPSRN